MEVEVGGRVRRVTVRRDGNGWAIALEGRTLTADVAASNGRTSLLMQEGASRRSYEVAVETRGQGEYTIYVDGHPVAARVAHPRALFGRRGHESSTAKGPARVASPMPGRVVKVLVKPGDAAASGQPLLVVEAMKMENELRAPRAGTVSEVRAVEGASIEANTVLVVIT